MNNFEKIKAMNIDEMADFLANAECTICIYNPDNCSCDCIIYDKDCKVGIQEWLLKECN